MTPITYPARIEEVEPGEFLVTFTDVPEALTSGATYAEAIGEAADALAVAMEGYILEGREAPRPRPIEAGEVEIGLSPAIAARFLLVSAMRDQALSKVALAELMHRDEKVVRRILSGKNASLDLTLEALGAVGIRPTLAA
ncbi:MAG: type II toxin-antitoxin system HicB family antitoxin [Pseudomonadota bacterium]|uniref:type II toxin-antitoxin system HicB family antitoxin n=1 Tax=Phenylobacterium sp. TaxID=1871053 RepID=UPI0025E37DD1|nr:type II toxin-antitoxin system HicB family antitoxin [Phenylobacterium sp.]MBT9472099.1 type II toxin-antitoxin system HicB family antitoxin [Phenylobacterium sp.]